MIPTIGDRRLAAAARALLLLLIFSLAFMRPSFRLLGFNGTPTDLIFIPLVLSWAAALLLRQAPLRWGRAHWLLAGYFAALTLSALASGHPGASAAKLASQVYLLSLPVIALSLIRDDADLRRAVRFWLAGTAVTAMVAVAALLLFYLDRQNPFLRHMLFYSGTLPHGNYPRVRLTFLNGNLLCNYLTVSLCLLLVAQRSRWITPTRGRLLGAGVALSAVLTISPGLGGFALALALWLWLCRRDSSPAFTRLALAAGIGAAVLFVAAMTVTPILHPTAPFLIHLPGTALILAPSGRLMTWMAAWRNFLADPLFGRGIGHDSVYVPYLDPSGHLQKLTDAHNSFLNLAAQCGVVGLVAFLLLLAFILRRTFPMRFLPGDANVVRLGLGLALLNGFAYQGLGGSFEDARHLWVLLGLFLAAVRLEDRGRSEPPLRSGHSSAPPP
ncbi:MAG: hypothetical protein QOH86_1130 [Sphingomonadales bacterium]|nr:hypothetical protein [Sphingomonadales bacterium]